MAGRKPPTSLFSRSRKLLSMAAQVAKEEVAHQVKTKVIPKAEELIREKAHQVRIEQAKAIVEKLSELKGAAMKAGQLLSLDAGDILPPEVREVLSKLQKNADPMPFEVIHRVLRDELGERFEELEDLSREAYAAASIGQVHRARYKGQDIVLKVQYPGISDSIDSDLNLLKGMATSGLFLFGKRVSLDEFFEECRQILHAEADYRSELKNLQDYHQAVQGEEHYWVPTPIPELSTGKVLAMTFEEGLDLRDWMARGPSHEDRLQLAHLVLFLYCREFYDWGMVQTDPNFANFLVRENPLRLVLLDFGATKRVDPEFRRRYRELLGELSTGKREPFMTLSHEMGFISPKESAEVHALYENMMIVSIEPFFKDLQPFQFNDQDYSKRTQQAIFAFTSALKYSPPPHQIIFFHRKLGGMFQMLKTLDVSMDLGPYWERLGGQALPQRFEKLT